MSSRLCVPDRRIFEGPFAWHGSIADPDDKKKVKGKHDDIWRLLPEVVIAQRRRRLGRWAETQHWYIDGLLRPTSDYHRATYGLPAVQIGPLSDYHMPMTVECAYLNRTLENVVAGVDSDVEFTERIRKATQYRARLSLDIDHERVVCRQVVVLPSGRQGVVTSIRPIPVNEMIRQSFGWLTERYEHPPRARPLDAVARTAADVYSAAPVRPALTVAEHFGWRTPDCPWMDDNRGRARVRRALKRAVELNYLPAAPGQRRRHALAG